MLNTNLKSLEDNIGYSFRNRRLLVTALTHSSYLKSSSSGKENLNERLLSNQRLEFLGDSVLSLVVSTFLFNSLPKLSEGELTKIRATLVCEKTLYSFAEKISLGEFLVMSKGEELTGGRTRPSVLADAFEAMLAAIFLDCDMNLETVKSLLLKFLPDADELKADIKKNKIMIKDYKTYLQEIIQQNREEKIEYNTIWKDGPAHEPIFLSEVLLNGQIIAQGDGTSKKIAEQNAAHQALLLMGSIKE